MTAPDLKAQGVINAIVPEPVGGAHREPRLVFDKLGDALEQAIRSLIAVPGGELRARRRQRHIDIGRVAPG